MSAARDGKMASFTTCSALEPVTGISPSTVSSALDAGAGAGEAGRGVAGAWAMAAGAAKNRAETRRILGRMVWLEERSAGVSQSSTDARAGKWVQSQLNTWNEGAIV